MDYFYIILLWRYYYNTNDFEMRDTEDEKKYR